LYSTSNSTVWDDTRIQILRDTIEHLAFSEENEESLRPSSDSATCKRYSACLKKKYSQEIDFETIRSHLRGILFFHQLYEVSVQ
jgi:hypothetical protein